MTLIKSNAVRIGAVSLIVAALVLMGNQRLTYAESLASDIICLTFNTLNGTGTPIPVLNANDCVNAPDEPAQCEDTIDNDGDGLIDYPADSGCENSTDNNENSPVIPIQCIDGLDNDEDGLTDLADPGCSGAADDDETNIPTPPTQCADGIDNDGDELTDLNDPGCANAEDDNETDATTTPQCADGSDNDEDGNIDYPADSGCSSADDDSENSPVIPIQCIDGLDNDEDGLTDDQFLNEFMKFGKANTPEQVRRLQQVLDSEGFAVDINGTFDAKTLEAVKAFQLKYADDILKPWGIEEPTGYVYLTTRKKVNEIYCKLTKQFPLTAEELGIIYRGVGGPDEAVSTNAVPSVPATRPKASQAAASAAPEVEVTTLEDRTAVGEGTVLMPDDEAPTESLGEKVKGFFSNIFGRFGR